MSKGDTSVLDAVLSDAKALRRQVSTLDQRKLDDGMNHVGWERDLNAIRPCRESTWGWTPGGLRRGNQTYSL